MYITYACSQCGFMMSVDENELNCQCEACESRFTIAQLVERRTAIEDLKKRVYEIVHADEENKRMREASDTQRYIDANENQTKQEEANIKLTEAEADLRRAQTRAANAEAANAGKAKTIIMNGPNSSMLGENAIKAFVAKDFNNAFTAADSVLAIDKDNKAAQFIKVYQDYAVNKRQVSMNSFIAKMSSDTYVVTDEELQAFEDLFATTPARFKDYEKQILGFVYRNSVGDPSKETATCKFVDKFCPEIIMSRTDHLFFTPEMAELYAALAGYCTIPKTCHTLICSINANPESPIKTERYYLKSVSTRFYNELVVPMEKVISSMKNDKYRAQFTDAYNKYRESFKQKAKI